MCLKFGESIFRSTWSLKEERCFGDWQQPWRSVDSCKLVIREPGTILHNTAKKIIHRGFNDLRWSPLTPQLLFESSLPSYEASHDVDKLGRRNHSTTKYHASKPTRLPGNLAPADFCWRPSLTSAHCCKCFHEPAMRILRFLPSSIWTLEFLIKPRNYSPETRWRISVHKPVSSNGFVGCWKVQRVRSVVMNTVLQCLKWAWRLTSHSCNAFPWHVSDSNSQRVQYDLVKIASKVWELMRHWKHTRYRHAYYVSFLVSSGRQFLIKLQNNSLWCVWAPFLEPSSKIRQSIAEDFLS